MTNGVTLQISLAPSDLPTARHTLPHQLKQWAGQVSEVLLVMDTHRSRGRYGEAFAERLPGMRELMTQCCAEYPHARILEVEYSPETTRRLGATFLHGATPPLKDYNGAPFYAYLYALDAARHPYVLHADSDMLFGGGSQHWVREAIETLHQHNDVLSVSPLPGPPTATGVLRSQTLQRVAMPSLAFRSPAFSTRVFMLDRDRLVERATPLPLDRLNPRLRLQSLMDGTPPVDCLEVCVSTAMRRDGFTRIDFLGSDPGMWAIHPPYRSALFYQRLPDLIMQVESGAIPEEQRGRHDIEDCMLDWRSARKPRWRRTFEHVERVMERAVETARQRVSA